MKTAAMVAFVCDEKEEDEGRAKHSCWVDEMHLTHDNEGIVLLNRTANSRRIQKNMNRLTNNIERQK